MKIKITYFCIIILSISTTTIIHSGEDKQQIKSYPFLLYDEPTTLFAMKQFNQNYESFYRILFREINENIKYPHSFRIELLLQLYFLTLIHEEAHRSILTYNDIGAISKPFPDWKGYAYVIGVTDQELKMLRDTDLPTYIRLHTAGLESDYCLLNRVRELFIYGEESYNILFPEYLTRISTLVGYFVTSPFKQLEPPLDEQENELKNDVVGHDVYGAIRHLHRPKIEFYRYTKYNDLTKDEKSFVKRAAFRSLLNLVDPMIFKKKLFLNLKNYKISFGLGYTMCPFGDFIDENIWLKNNKLNTHIYLRQFNNKNRWFWGSGINVRNYPISDKYNISSSFHVWTQPKMMSFTSKNSNFGAGCEIFVHRKFLTLKNDTKRIVLDFGLLAKTAGFIPEELNMNKHFQIRVGSTLIY